MTTVDDDHDHEPASRDYITYVHAEYVQDRCNHRLLFGEPKACHTLISRPGLTRQRHLFLPGSRFGLDCWKRNAYGTVQWRCFVCETLSPGELAECVPHVTPAARVLLATKGAAQSKLFLAWLKLVVDAGLDPLKCPAATFEAAHFRLWGVRADRVPPQRLSGRP
jgi:Protein of unknown function (DUF2840)